MKKILATGGLVMFAMGAVAADNTNWYLTPRIGYTLTDIDRHADDAPAFGLEIKTVAIIREGRSGVLFVSPRGLAVDERRGEFLLANTGMHRIEFFDLTGKAVGQVTHRVETDDGTLIEGQPRSVAVDPSGRLIVVDQMAAYVNVLDFRGRSVGRLELPPPDNDPNLANAPGRVVVGRDGSGYEKELWSQSGTFRQGRQENLLIADNQTRRFASANQSLKDQLIHSAWGSV